jgi:hypothetical protein
MNVSVTTAPKYSTDEREHGVDDAVRDDLAADLDGRGRPAVHDQQHFRGWPA